jgi:hypothetical protein
MNDSPPNPPACLALWLDRILAAGLLVSGLLWIGIESLALQVNRSENTAGPKLFIPG